MPERMNRRHFLRDASLTTIGGALATRSVLAEAGPAVAGDGAKVRTGEKGASDFSVTVNNVSGVPLGGIGAGSVEVRPDGYFADWLIFNMGAWSPEQPNTESGPAPDMGHAGLQFFVRCEQPGSRPRLRRLGIREDMNDLYSVAYALPVEAIQFDGKFPFATLKYVDETLPVTVTGVAFAPIVPGDAQTSATPGFTVAFKVHNPTKRALKVSLLGALQNPLAWGAADRKLHNDVETYGETTAINLRTSSTEGRKSVHGSMGFSVTGGTATTIAGTYRSYLGNGEWGGSRGYGSAHYSFLHAYYRDGVLPNVGGREALDSLLVGSSDGDIDKLSLVELRDLFRKFEQDAFFHEYIARVRSIDPSTLMSHDGLANLVKEFRDRLNRMSGDNRDRSSWGDVALESTISLKPGEEREIRFALSWYFPNHFSALGPNLGHQYEHWFSDAADVNRFLVTKHSEHRQRTVDFAETILATNLKPEIGFAWGAQLSTLIKSSWWCKDGRFAIWEGLGCCGLHTTDITYQGSFPIIALFPELQMRQVKMGASYQRKDGRIPHFFSPDLLHVDNGFDRVDMNPQYVMMVCRDYLWTGDVEFARENWPQVVKAMASTQRLDGDGDGIPDRDTRRNTYDQWDLEGSPAYICSLWLGALVAAIRLADDLGEKDQAATWRALHAKASKSFIERLWNGSYFNLWVSDSGKDECCMSDQLSGEWYTGMMGLRHSVELDTIRTALGSVYKHNFDTDTGLLNATYPEGSVKRFKTHQNLQAAGNWTGIEYANAALMIEMGMVAEGLSIMESVHKRYVRSGRRWNHVECGDHYFRAMSSWTTLLALTGLRLDRPRASLTVHPVIPGLIAPWFVPGAYGVLAASGKTLTLDCKAGVLELQSLSTPVLGKTLAVSLPGGNVSVRVDIADGVASVDFGKVIQVAAGQSLRLRWS